METTPDVPLPLSALPAGATATIHALQGGHEFRSRLANLGFTGGTTVTVTQNYGHGPMLVSVRGALVALGRAEAAKVLVSVRNERAALAQGGAA